MQKVFTVLRGKFWVISAILFGPWHAAIVVAILSRLTAGTALGTAMSSHDHLIKSVLVVVFSLYFVLAFMMWVVGRRAPGRGTPDRAGEAAISPVAGLSIKQVIGWGLVGMVLMPALMVVSAVANRAYFMETFKHIFAANATVNAGFIWLLSIATVIMIPTMVIWLVWMWRMWSHTDTTQREAESWDYEYD